MFTFNLGAAKTRVEIISGQPVYQYLFGRGVIDANGIPKQGYTVQYVYDVAAEGGYAPDVVYMALNWGTAEAQALFAASNVAWQPMPAATTVVSGQNTGYALDLLRSGNPYLNQIRTLIISLTKTNPDRLGDGQKPLLNSDLSPRTSNYKTIYEYALSQGGWGGYSVGAELMRAWEMTGQYSLAQYQAQSAPVSPTAPLPVPGSPAPTIQPAPSQSVQTSVATGSVNSPAGGGNVNYSVPITVTQNPDGSLSYTVVSANGPVVNNPAALPPEREVKSNGALLALLIAAISMLQ